MNQLGEMIDIVFSDIGENSKPAKTKQERIKELEEELQCLKAQVEAEEKGKEEFMKDINSIIQKNTEYLSNNPSMRIVLESLIDETTKFIF